MVRGLSRSPHTTPKSLMDADIVRFLLCLLEEGDEPADEQEVRFWVRCRVGFRPRFRDGGRSLPTVGTRG